MRVGLVARCRDRGLGTMTWEFARAMAPAKVLVVMRDEADFVDEARFPGARWTKLDADSRRSAHTGARIPDADLRWLLEDVDVVYTAETPYDYRLFILARTMGVGTALHGMWEYLPYRADPTLPRPDLFLAPSPWHLDEWPQPCQLLPVPVAADRLPPRRPAAPARTLVHVAAAASGDRSGTQALLAALPYTRGPERVLVRSQTPLRTHAGRRAPGSPELVLLPESSNYWDVLEGADAAVLPRRYGGLSLPLQEATALGLPVLGLDREASAGYPWAAQVPTQGERPLRLPAGPVGVASVAPRRLGAAMSRLATDAAWCEELAEASRAAGALLTWEALRPAYDEALASAAR